MSLKWVERRLPGRWLFWYRPEIWTTLIFSLFNFLLGVGYSCGFYSSQALFIHHIGTRALFYVYLIEALSALGLATVFYFFVDRYTRRSLFNFCFLFSGLFVLLSWGVLRAEPEFISFYLIVRVLFYAIFIFTGLEFWLIASEFFTHFEAKRRFPILMAAGIVGEMLGGLFISVTAQQLHTVNFFLFWSAILLFSPLLFVRKGCWRSGTGEVTVPTSAEGKRSSLSSSLPFLLFIFWVAYSFFSHGTDYLFNTIALENLRDQDILTVFFGKIAFIASGAVLVYQLLIAVPLTVRCDVGRTIWILPVLSVTALAGFYFLPSLTTVSLAEGAIYFFCEAVAITLLQPLLSLFPTWIRGRRRIRTEGMGRPVGTLLLLVIAAVTSFNISVTTLSALLFAGAIVFLVYPILFRGVYLRHLLSSLEADEPGLVSNAIQALGESNKKRAVAPLLSLLQKSRAISLKRTIVLSLGRIRSREAFKDIVSLFSVRDESLQLAVVEALSEYRNYESILILFRLMRSHEIVSFEVRMNAVTLLTRILGKKMIPFLLDALDDPDARVSANAIESIGRLHDKEAVPLIVPFLKHENHRVRANAVVALYPFRAMRDTAKEVLQQLYESDLPEPHRAALYAIGILKLKSYQEELIARLSTPDPALFQLIVTALARMKDPRFSKPLVENLVHWKGEEAITLAKRMALFPHYSRLLVIEEISRLSSEERTVAFERLEKTGLDFSIERVLSTERHLIEWPVRL